MKILTDGSYSIADDINIDAEGASSFVFGRGWLLEIIELVSGEYYFKSGGEDIRPRGSRFGVFYPSFTLVSAYVKNMKGLLTGIGSVRLIAGLPAMPVIFETGFSEPLTNVAQVPAILEEASELRSIELNPRASVLSSNAKHLIDTEFDSFPSIAQVARSLGVTHSHLSRQFRRDYQMSPSTYLNHLRVAEATFRISTGEPIIEASFDAGYNDLSRFYKQFRKATKVSPGACRSMLDADTSRSKNAKTTPSSPKYTAVRKEEF